ncbi:glycerol kinase [Arthrobacter sp. Hiyo6]|nr:glycerol kinase [Arthrobacter sp. Hiyo6]
MNTGDTPVSSANGMLTTIAWGIGGKVEYALEGLIFVAAASIQWLRDELRVIYDSADSEYAAMRVPDSGGVYVVPAFTGLAAPYWDPYARGAILGLTRGSSRNHIIRATLESIAFQIKDVINCMEADAGLPVSEIRSMAARCGTTSSCSFRPTWSTSRSSVPARWNRPRAEPRFSRAWPADSGTARTNSVTRSHSTGPLCRTCPKKNVPPCTPAGRRPSPAPATGKSTNPPPHRPPTSRERPVTLLPAVEPTMYFIGVTTNKSSIMKVFPAWAKELGLNATLKGIDLPLGAPREAYREVVGFLKSDPMSLGALVTTHKLDIVSAARDLFDDFGPDAQLLHEISSISKRSAHLWGNAMDAVTSGLSLEAILPGSYWENSSADLVLLGAGGSSLALTLYLHKRAAAGLPGPKKIIVTNRRSLRLEEMREMHVRIGSTLPITYVQATDESTNDDVVANASPGSLIINATGLGKDRPGSPLTDGVTFPQGAIAWDFNYRGDLVFLDQARAQQPELEVQVEDGWVYFIHGWTRVIADVFNIDIPTRGAAFDRLSNIAQTVSQKENPS